MKVSSEDPKNRSLAIHFFCGFGVATKKVLVHGDLSESLLFPKKLLVSLRGLT